MKGYFNYIKKFKLFSLGLLFLALLNTICQLAFPNIASQFIDSISSGHSELIYSLIISFVMIYLFSFLLNLVLSFTSQKYAWKITNQIRREVLSHVLNLDLDFHKSHSDGELMERIEGDISQVFDIFSSILIDLFLNLLLLMGILINLYYINIFAFIIFIGYFLIAIYSLKKIHEMNERKWIQASKANASIFGFIGELLDNACLIKIQKLNQYALKKITSIFNKNKKPLIKANETWASISNATDFIFTIGTILSFFLAIILFENGKISVGVGYLIFSYIQMLRRPLEQIRMDLQALQTSGASFKRIKDLLSITTDVHYGIKTIPNQMNKLDVHNIHFKYQNADAYSLVDINFSLCQGMKLGIIGRSGSGKSTLVNLIAHLLNLQSGSIKINGIHIESIAKEKLYQHISLVTQDIFIIDGTLRENITLFDNCLSDKQIYDTLENIGLTSFIKQFPNGLNEVLSNSLPQSTIQVIHFIRAVICGGQLFIFDEITAKLDLETEKKILHAIDVLANQAICIFISHKILTTQHMTHLLVLENGKQLFYGTRESILDQFDLQSYLAKEVV